MCIDFDGHHSGGSSFDSFIRCGPYPQVAVRFKKKNKKIRSRVLVLSLASRKPVQIRHSGRAGKRGVTLLTTLKKCLHSTKVKWVDELPRVLWAYRITI